jgi:predicted MFS family arabinose efflux permease
MNSRSIGPSPILSVITIVLGALLALFLLLFGVGNLIHPDVPDSYLDQNTRVCVMVIFTGLMTIYAIFRPYSGGILLCICALTFFVIVIRNPISVPVIGLGILSVVRGRLQRRKVSEGTNQPS